MRKSYKLKIYANRGKLEKIDSIIDYWRSLINEKIDIFWNFEAVVGAYPSKEYRVGSRFINSASIKAWQIVKGVRNCVYKFCDKLQDLVFDSKEAKKLRDKIEKRNKKPVFTGNLIELDEMQLKFSEYKNSFDF